MIGEAAKTEAMTDIRVPDGMLKAAMVPSDGPAIVTICGSTMRAALQAALLWLSENPIVPTDEQIDDLAAEYLRTDQQEAWPRWFIGQFERQMFRKPTPASPLAEIISTIDKAIDGMSLEELAIAEAKMNEIMKGARERAASAQRFGASRFEPETGCRPSCQANEDGSVKAPKSLKRLLYNEDEPGEPKISTATANAHTREAFYETPFGRIVIDPRVPPGEIRMHSWDGPTLMKNIGKEAK